MYARGILFGKMKYELGDHAMVRCPETGLEADIEFKVKGWMGGTYNSIGGYIKESKTGKNLYELDGYWHGKMSIKDLSTGKKEVLFDATHAKPSIPKSRPIEEQAPRESQRLWYSTTQAIKKADQRVATDEKSKIEDEQRREAAERGENAWRPKLFKQAPPGDEEKLDWIIDTEVDSSAPAEKQVEQILSIAPILPGSTESKDHQSAKSLPSQQGKALPQPPESSKTAGGGGDLIDFGQNDNPQSAPGSSAQVQSIQKAQPARQNMQEPLMPVRSNERGQPLRRTDSIGNEETFVDAEM